MKNKAKDILIKIGVGIVVFIVLMYFFLMLTR